MRILLCTFLVFCFTSISYGTDWGFQDTDWGFQGEPQERSEIIQRIKRKGVKIKQRVEERRGERKDLIEKVRGRSQERVQGAKGRVQERVGKIKGRLRGLKNLVQNRKFRPLKKVKSFVLSRPLRKFRESIRARIADRPRLFNRRG